MQQRLDRDPGKMRQRRERVEHPFGTIKSWMGATHFLMKTLDRLRTEMAKLLYQGGRQRSGQKGGVGGIV